MAYQHGVHSNDQGRICGLRFREAKPAVPVTDNGFWKRWEHYRRTGIVITAGPLVVVAQTRLLPVKKGA